MNTDNVGRRLAALAVGMLLVADSTTHASDCEVSLDFRTHGYVFALQTPNTSTGDRPNFPLYLVVQIPQETTGEFYPVHDYAFDDAVFGLDFLMQSLP